MAAAAGVRRAMLLDCCVSLTELAADLRVATISADHAQAALVVQRLGREVMMAAEVVKALQDTEPVVG